MKGFVLAKALEVTFTSERSVSRAAKTDSSTEPRQRCHACEWVGFPARAQICPSCGARDCLSIVAETRDEGTPAGGDATGPISGDAEPPRCQRYDPDFWCLGGGRGKRGRKSDAEKAAAEDELLLAQTRADSEHNLSRCRELLVEMDAEELKRRLTGCRWNLGGSGAAHTFAIQEGKALDDR